MSDKESNRITLNGKQIIRTRGLLFDMDGVLLSSIASVQRCWAAWAEMYGVPPEKALRVTHGRRAIDTVITLRPDIDPVAGMKAIEDLEVADTQDTKALPGAVELLQSLPTDRWTIVTSASARLTKVRLAAAGIPMPDKLVTADNVTVGKPDPEPYRKGAELLGLSAADCIVVEDAPAGVGAGVAAGSRVLGITGHYSAEDLKATEWVVGSLADVKASVVGEWIELRV